jgi:hypothetical protein
MNYLIVAVLCLALCLALTLGAAATALSDLRRALRDLRVRPTADF